MRLEFAPPADWGLTWRALEPASLERTSHALVEDGCLWLVDPVDGEGLRDALAGLGEPAGVLQLLDRHGRDCDALAADLGVPLHRVPYDGVPASPFAVVPVVRLPFWREVALWWEARRVLVVADAFGRAPHYLAPGEELAVHPFLRLMPPRRLAALEPEHLLLGHGGGLHGAGTGALVHEAVATARRRIPRWLAGLPRARFAGRRRARAQRLENR
jgi:hypothetical protein